MSRLLREGAVNYLLGAYGRAGGADLVDPTLVGKIQQYRRVAGGRLQALPLPEVSRRLSKSGNFISRKIDGHCYALVKQGVEAALVNAGGTVLVGLPLLEEACTLLEDAGVAGAVVMGEVYVDIGGRRCRVHDVTRALRTPSEQGLATVRLAAFDILALPTGEAVENYETAWSLLQRWFDSGERVHPVETVIGTPAELERLYERWVGSEGAEGVVVRAVTGAFKIKPQLTLDAVVMGFAEGVDDRSGMLHDLLLALMRPDGSFHLLGKVGGGFTDEERVTFRRELEGEVVASEYIGSSSNGVAYKMVRPERVVEIVCTDLYSETTRGTSILQRVLCWNAEQGCWEIARRLPLVSILSPRFSRLRPEKAVHPDDVSIRQVAERVEVDLLDAGVDDLALAASVLLRREVWIKSTRGGVMVRKLLLWQTNKEGTGEYPAFVVYGTDFSPNRKEPLKRDIRVSSSRQQIDDLYLELADKYFVTGWQALGPDPLSAGDLPF